MDNDIFGNFPNRPDHPDFWRLSQIVLRMDGRMQDAIARGASEDEKQEIWDGNVRRWIDPDVLNYTAMQRAMRAAGVETQGDLMSKMPEVIKGSTLWQEGFQYGAEFATRPLHEDTLDDLDVTGLRLLLTSYEAHVKKAHKNGDEPLSVVEFFNTLSSS